MRSTDCSVLFQAAYNRGWGPTTKAERWNGRHAMFGWIALLVTGYAKGHGLIPNPDTALDLKVNSCIVLPSPYFTHQFLCRSGALSLTSTVAPFQTREPSLLLGTFTFFSFPFVLPSPLFLSKTSCTWSLVRSTSLLLALSLKLLPALLPRYTLHYTVLLPLWAILTLTSLNTGGDAERKIGNVGNLCSPHRFYSEPDPYPGCHQHRPWWTPFLNPCAKGLMNLLKESAPYVLRLPR